MIYPKNIEILNQEITDVPLMVKCKSCGGQFTSKYQMSVTSVWHKPNTTINLQQICPECGVTNYYTKEDHFFQ